MNKKTLKNYVSEASELYVKHGKITPSLLAKQLKIDNYAAGYVVDYMKENKLLGK